MVKGFIPLLLLLCLIVPGCSGGEGGSAGDTSDPATTTDLEQRDEDGQVDASGDTE
jgi:hypothetical protein